MNSTTIRIGADLHSELKEIAKKMKTSMQVVIERAIRDYQDKLYWQDMDAAYKKLREDPKALEEMKNEQNLWETTVDDGFSPPN
jgi:predicted transcriptional regulator